ncbi:MAG: DUF934 domain-containing protein, partial [Cellvibrionaceae bacterium]
MQNKPTQNKMIKDGQVIDNTWELIGSTDTDPNSTETIEIPTSNVLVPLALWQAQTELQGRDNVGIWLDNDCNLNDVAEKITSLPVIAIHFPVFMDGRGFSLARLLRERYGYKGEIRAIGHIIRDQLCYLKRCGFNAFTFNDEDLDINAAVESLKDFSEAYQTSVDMPEPLF